MVYTAESRSLAVLEVLVNLEVKGSHACQTSHPCAAYRALWNTW